MVNLFIYVLDSKQIRNTLILQMFLILNIPKILVVEIKNDLKIKVSSRSNIYKS